MLKIILLIDFCFWYFDFLLHKKKIEKKNVEKNAKVTKNFFLNSRKLIYKSSFRLQFPNYSIDNQSNYILEDI